MTKATAHQRAVIGRTAVLNQQSTRKLVKRRMIWSAPVAVATTILSLGFLPGTAQAAYPCPTDWVCLYQNTNATGSASVQPRLNPASGGYVGVINDFRNSHYTNGASLQDSVSSIVNNTNQFVLLAEHINQSGRKVLITPYSGLTNLNDVYILNENGSSYRGSFEDLASSAAAGTCGGCFPSGPLN
ncbi:peptidase inhibitor family I36 protein [Micromonospora sp. NPDC048898]|uniref:peptidase inhibitor family I36 protein n=1 Tax=Micromonospora sp. NPDC048898 TaxID=3364260 RepID=UPI003716C5E7